MADYVVVGPYMTYVVPLLDDGTGPYEDGADCYLVRNAPNAKAAKWAAWRHAKSTAGRYPWEGTWPGWVRVNETHPLSGVKAEAAGPRESEGWPACAIVEYVEAGS